MRGRCEVGPRRRGGRELDPIVGTARRFNGTEPQKPTVVDLFAGAGGLSLGLHEAGFETVLALDSWKAAVLTWNANLGQRAEVADLAGPIELPACDLVVGGPPCQGFSSAGLRRENDHRTTLVRHFAHIIAARRPRAFVFENVEGFLTYAAGDRVLDLLEPLVEAGYRIHLRKINAGNYGVPQHRKRVIAIGGLGFDPGFPEPTHRAYGAPGAHLAGRGRLLPLAPTLEDALKGLPAPATVAPGNPPDHWFKPLTGLDLERARAMQPGQRMRDIPEELWHDSYRRRAYRRVMDGTATERRGGAPVGLGRLRGDEPSKAITSGARSEFLHPSENRTLTIRECARIQTLPDDFVLQGSLHDRMVLVGNAVPRRLARAIGRSLAGDLASAPPCGGEGALLSFVPTLSEGMSPVLRHVCERVASRFGLGADLPEESGVASEALRLWG